jgi:hypothetical protein
VFGEGTLMSGTNWYEFRARYDKNIFTVYGFDQIEFLRDRGYRNCDGICRELCRMWLNARNFPIMTEDLGKHPVSGLEWAPELELLYKNFHTLTISQAMADAKITGRDAMIVNGLAAQYSKCNKIGDLGNQLLANHGTLAIAAVQMTNGYHAIAFDTRNTVFIMFDPNKGMFVAKQKFNTTEFLREYFEMMNYNLMHITKYTAI